MITKKILLFVALLSASLGASADSWQVIPSYEGTQTQNVVDAGSRVYYLVSNCLYCYDKETQENASLNRANRLSDVVIKDIYFNDIANYLLIVYQNANIDVITAEGKVINLPEIKNSTLNIEKSINDITFASAGRIYVATSFGYVIYSDTKWEVIESHIFGEDIASVAELNDLVLVSQAQKIYCGKVGKHYETLGSMPLAGGALTNDNGRLRPLTNSRLLLLTGWTILVDVTYDEAGFPILSFDTSVSDYTNNVQTTPSGFLLNCYASNCYYTLSHEVAALTRVDAEGEMWSAYSGGNGTLWSAGENGLRNSTAPEVYYKPAALSMSTPFYLTWNDAQQLLYVSSTGTNAVIDNQYMPTAINTYDGSSFNDVTPSPEPENGGTYYPVFFDKGNYFLGSWWTGVFKVVDGVISTIYNWENSPLQHLLNNYYCHAQIALDSGGNLWVAQTGAETGKNIFVLPKAKQAQTTVGAADWITVNVPNVKMTKRGILRPLQHSNVKVIYTGEYNGVMAFVNDAGSPSASPETKSISSGAVVDQDGGSVTWNYIYALTEDRNGLVWIGSNDGVTKFDPKKAFSADFTINRIKVPRNDGTNLADYLLNGITVTCIAVDGANRKWIGTKGSGVFCVSADGTTVTNSFNTSNSVLLSDYIYNICCDPNSNAVYITTSAGMMQYLSDNMPAEGNFSNVLAYPNPVRPDYYGMITIKGLMDNSLVKIAGVDGNVVKTLKSEGGMAQWDGANADGERVKSGVYFIFASQSAADSKESAVAKILIIR